MDWNKIFLISGYEGVVKPEVVIRILFDVMSPSVPILKDLIPILLATHIPVVFTDRPGDENADFVGVDNFREAQRLIRSFSIKPKMGSSNR